MEEFFEVIKEFENEGNIVEYGVFDKIQREEMSESNDKIKREW